MTIMKKAARARRREKTASPGRHEQRESARTHTGTKARRRSRASYVPSCLRAWRPSANGARKRGRPLAGAENARDAAVGWQLRASVHRGHREIELGPAAFAGQRGADRMKGRAALLACLLLDPIRGRTERVAVEQQTLDRAGQRGDDLA